MRISEWSSDVCASELVELDGAPRMAAELHADFIGRDADLEEGQAVPGFTQHAASLNMRPQLTCCRNSRSLGFSGLASSSAGGPSTAILPSSMKISRVPPLPAQATSWVPREEARRDGTV